MIGLLLITGLIYPYCEYTALILSGGSIQSLGLSIGGFHRPFMLDTLTFNGQP